MEVLSQQGSLTREQRKIDSESDVPSRPMAKMTREEAVRELEALRQRGLYQGPGSVPAERSQALRPEQYVREDAPVVEERVRSREIHEVIPEIRREREVAEIRHAVLPVHEHVREDRTYSQRELDEIREREYRIGTAETDRRKNRALVDRLSKGYRDVQATRHEYVYRQPHVQEIVKPRIIHEVHPVLQREIEKEHYEREILPIRERIIEGPHVADELEILRPIDRNTWEATHGSDLYEREGWRYGRDAHSVIEREPVFREMLPPSTPRRASLPAGRFSEGTYPRRGITGRSESYSGFQQERAYRLRGENNQSYERGYYEPSQMGGVGPTTGGYYPSERRYRGDIAPAYERGRGSGGRYGLPQNGGGMGMLTHRRQRNVSPSSSSSSSSEEDEYRRYKSYREPGVTGGTVPYRYRHSSGGVRRRHHIF